MSNMEDNPFHTDYLAEYHYDPSNNEVVIFFKHRIERVEASVLIETLADLIREVSFTQSSASTVNKHE